MSTILQTRLLKLISESISNSKKRITLAELMRKAGYSESQSRSPGHIFKTESFKKELNPVIIKMLKLRDASLARAAKTVGKAKYRDAIDGVDKLTKNTELLSGRATERHAVLDDEKKSKIDEMMEDSTE